MAKNSLIPFKHAEDLSQYIPRVFIEKKDGSKEYTWFITAPKHTTFRVNTKKYKCQDVMDIIHQHLLNEATIRNTQPSNVYIHEIVDDCIVISNSANDCKPNSSEHVVIIDVPCANAVLRGADIFAPGVLSLSSKAKIGDVVNIFADIERKCKRGFNKPFIGKTLFVGSGTVKITRNELFKQNAITRGIAIEVYWNLTGIPRLEFSEDVGLLQNFPSIVCGHLFNRVTGNVLDMCASPGNKTTHIATILGEKGVVTALDKTPEKVSRIVKLCERFGLTNVKCYLCDSTKCVAEDETNNCNLSGPPFRKESFSAVLLDPPCSALGQRPSLMNDISPSQLKSFVFLQRQLFRSAVKALCDGGLLVYSTCTITLEENEEMVSWALKHFPELELKKVEPLLGHPGLPESSLSIKERELVSRFGYHSGDMVNEDTIGFFIACFNKKIKRF